MNVTAYLDYLHTPWGRLFYRLVWHNIEFKNKTILDFGSGFGLTADHLAVNNDVIAMEPNTAMLEHRFHDHPYTQLTGSVEQLKEMKDGSFDVILCHNVLEYVENRAEVIAEFRRLLKNGGVLSVVKHHKNGKVMHKAVFENNIEEAMSLLNGGHAASQNFGTISEYDLEELQHYLTDQLIIDKVYGIRTFYGIQPNAFKSDPAWEDQMFMLERAVEHDPAYANIAFFQHLLIRKESN